MTPIPTSAPDRSQPMTPEKVLQRIDWTVIRRLDGLLQGDYRSLFYGYGVDFADVREYQPGDDVRYIDWNVTARMDSPYVRQYVEDREITAWFLVDTSPSMEFGTTGSEKRSVQVQWIVTLARLMTRHGNRIGAMLYSGNRMDRIDRTIPPKGGRPQVLRIIHELMNQSAPKRLPLTDLSPLLLKGLHGIKKRSLVFVLSDFISSAGWERPLKLLNQRHDVVAIRVLDPRELEIPDVGVIVMEDAETGDQLRVDTHDAQFRARFREAALKRELHLAQAAQRAGVDLLSISTEDDLVRAIFRMAAMRKQRRKG